MKSEISELKSGSMDSSVSNGNSHQMSRTIAGTE
jgi:hypothetical protein